MLVVICVTAAAPLVSNEAEAGYEPVSSSGGPSIGLVAAMAAIVTGLVAVAIGVTVRHIRKRRQVSMETGTVYDNDESDADCSKTSRSDDDFNGAIQSTS